MKSLSSTVAGNVVPAASYSAGSYTLTGLVVGTNYYFTMGANDTSIAFGSGATHLKSARATGVFTATATSATLAGSGTSAVGTTVSPIYGVPLFPATVTPTTPTKLVTVGQFPAYNPNFSRAIQISDQYVFVKRGTYAVAFSLTDIVNLALTGEVNLTWTPPVQLTAPSNAACVHSSTAATFTIVAGSEYTVTYQWQYSTDGGTTWASATGTVSGCVYTNDTTATLTCTPTTTGQTGKLHRCVVTDNAGSYGLTNGVLYTDSAILTIT